MSIGSKIRELRKKKGVTQEQLANSLHISFQAVSKWENNIAMPDITLAPVIARYFGVTMDELFEFDLKEIEEKALDIAKESWKYRSNNWEKALSILDEGLKNYPDNDILLINKVYVIDFEKEPDRVIEIASKVADVTNDDALRYDAYRFMAYAYKAKGDIESARKAIDQIPEFYFSHLSEKAKLVNGDEQLQTAGSEEGASLKSLLEMKEIISKYYEEKGDIKCAITECEQALKVLDALEVHKVWDWAKNLFNERLFELKTKLK